MFYTTSMLDHVLVIQKVLMRILDKLALYVRNHHLATVFLQVRESFFVAKDSRRSA